ncbi:organic cation transporter [Brachionus plicatilis]|uniref:Organic cation transporter n=1 Tax=Brachionus plicatilis TaxID=10195 RepID=A0A3M7SBV2_BRAPC|nr:organic cation transporter [Brachionus plicatilis]
MDEKNSAENGKVECEMPLTLSEFNMLIRNSTKHQNKSCMPESLRKKSKNTNLDHVLEQVGSFGFYQKIQFLLVGFLALVPSMVAYSYVFVSATPKFSCSIVEEIQLISYDDEAAKLLNKFIIDQASRDPFENLREDKAEYFVEIRRGIRIQSPDSTNIIYDNNCKIDSDILIQKLNLSSHYGSTKTKGIKKVKSLFKCIEWVYDRTYYGRTTVTDMELVCLKSHLKALSQNAYIIGTGCSVFTGILSDKFGRKRIMIILIIVMVLVLHITQFFLHTKALEENSKFIIFTISRFIQGIAQTMYTISFVLLLEITGPKNRVTAGNILAYALSIGQMIIAGMAYYFKDYLKVQWALAIYVMPFFMYYWMVPESPRWLLSVNKVRQARHVIKKILRVNSWYENLEQRVLKYLFNKKIEKKTNVDLENEQNWVHVFTMLQEEANQLSVLKKTTSYRQTIMGITRSPVLMKRCFILFYTWMVILAVYLGIGMGISGNLDKFINPYLVFVIAAGFEFLSVVTCHFVLDKFGRKIPLCCFIIMTSVAIYIIPIYFETYPWISIVAYFFAKYTIGAAQSTCMIFTSELYPTPMRSTGIGLSVALARIGGVWAPQINVLSSTLGSIYVPFTIFSIISFFAGVLCFLLPETLNKRLPENLKDAKDLEKDH